MHSANRDKARLLLLNGRLLGPSSNLALILMIGPGKHALCCCVMFSGSFVFCGSVVHSLFCISKVPIVNAAHVCVLKVVHSHKHT